MNPVVTSVVLVHGTNKVCLGQHGLVDGMLLIDNKIAGLCLCKRWKWQFNHKTDYRWWLSKSTKYWGAFINKTQQDFFFWVGDGVLRTCLANKQLHAWQPNMRWQSTQIYTHAWCIRHTFGSFGGTTGWQIHTIHGFSEIGTHLSKAVDLVSKRQKRIWRFFLLENKSETETSLDTPKKYTSWGLNQPIWKIWSSNWIISPRDEDKQIFELPSPRT